MSERTYLRAEAVRVVGDEDGFELHIDTVDGDRLVVNVQAVAWDLAADVDAMRQAAAIADAEAYALDDPKHPTWADRQADRHA